jgi:Coenzyme PQQ synthesis protein D (PqqD)
VEKLDREAPLRVASANVHSKAFGDEVVVLDMQSGTYFSLRGSAVDAWEMIERNASGARIAEALQARYDAPAAEVATAVGGLLDELAEAGLIVADGSVEPRGGLGEAAESGPYVPPQLERFTDMQELLLLDPIHEVDDTGWPHTPATR